MSDSMIDVDNSTFDSAHKKFKYAKGSGQSEFFDNFITLDELLALLKHRYSRSTIGRWRRKLGMPCVRLNNGRLWFSKTEIFQWLERRGLS